MVEASLVKSLPAMRHMVAELLDEIRSAPSFERLRALNVETELLVEPLATAIFNVHVTGRAQVFAEIEERIAAAQARLAAVVLEPEFEPLPFTEAIEFFRNKVNLSREQFDRLVQAAQNKAFTIAASARPVVTGHIRDLVDAAQSEGLTLREFQDQAEDVLARAGIEPRQPWYWQTVYRTNLQSSYQAGRWKQMTDPEVVRERPYLRYVSARLPTSRPSHVEKHGLIYPVGHAFWDAWYPPNGFNCYCTAVSVSESLLERRGWQVSEATDFEHAAPDPGFQTNPGSESEI